MAIPKKKRAKSSRPSPEPVRGVAHGDLEWFLC